MLRVIKKATGRTPEFQSTQEKPGEVLIKNVGEKNQHKDYRSIMGKIMFSVTKIDLECIFVCGQLARLMYNLRHNIG